MEAKELLYYWVGLDVGKREFSAAVELGMGDRKLGVGSLPCRKFNHTKKGVAEFLKWVDKTTGGRPFKVVMEATGHYSVALCKLLQGKRKGLECSIVNPYLTSNFLKSLGLPHKTDDGDARGIARFGMERRPPTTPLLPRQMEEMRELFRQRAALVETRSEFKNRAESRVGEVAQALNDELLETLDEYIARIEKALEELAGKIPWMKRQVELMLSIPGVGAITAIGLSAELGDLGLYTRQGISAASGLAPRLHESGTSVKASWIGRRGSRHVRHLLFLSSNQAIRKIPYLNAMYDRLLAKGKTKMQVKCACMRVLIQIIRSVVVHERPYSEDFSYKSLEKSLKTA
jgi:transposase